MTVAMSGKPGLLGAIRGTLCDGVRAGVGPSTDGSEQHGKICWSWRILGGVGGQEMEWPPMERRPSLYRLAG